MTLDKIAARGTSAALRPASHVLLLFLRAAGRFARDASVERLGYDIASQDPSSGAFRFITVKAVRSAADPVRLTRGEVLASLNAGDAYWVACVPTTDTGIGEPVLVRAPIAELPPFSEAALTLQPAAVVTGP